MTQTDKPRLLLIDGHSVAYRAFYALPVENFSTSTGQHTNAVYGFTSMLINLLRDEKPTHVAVAFDVSRQTFRTEEYPEYKANRAKTPDEFAGQVALIQQVLDALNITHIELDGFEADDVIGTLTADAERAGWDTLICTGDRDSMQLVSESTTVLYPLRGVSDLARMTPEAVETKYLVPPRQYPELAALVGETSDNLPGVPGVGPKTAAKWIAQFGGLEELLANADSVRGKVGESLRDHLDDVKRNRRLNALVRDLDLPVTLGELERRDWDREAVHTLFDSLEFRVLRERLLDTLPQENSEASSGFDIEGSIIASGHLAGVIEKELTGAGLIGVEIVGSWGAGHGDVRGIGLANSDSAFYVDVAELTVEDDAALARWLANPDAPKAMHGAKGPIQAIWDRGWDIRGLASDTHLAAYVLRPDQRVFDLADLSLRYLGRELTPSGSAEDAHQQPAFDFGGEDANDAMLRARAVAELAGVLEEELRTHSVAELVRDVEMPLQRTLAGMERRGIAVDLAFLDRLWSDFDDAVRAAESDAYDVIGKQINLVPQAVAGGPFRRTGDAQDQAHPNRLHHRRRGVGVAVREDRAPVPGAPAPTPRPDQAEADGRGAPEVGGGRRTDPHDVRPDHNGHRTPQLHRSEPPEHPGAHRGREAHQGGLRRWWGVRVASDRRLQPDRDADHGAPVG